MNKVITINLAGTAFQLEEAAYDTLRAYLDQAARQLAANPDRGEIIADIERAIGDKCRAVLNPHKNVVLAREIEQIIAEMGPVDDGSTAGTTAASDTPRSDSSPPKADAAGAAAESATTGRTGSVRRLYRVYEGAMLSGVCNGIAAYLGLDPTIVRVVFVLLACLTLGGMAVAYLVLVLLLPSARTPEEKAAAHGAPSTAQEFIRRAREGYYQAAKTWGNKQAHREWKQKFRHEMRAWKSQFRHSMAQPSPAASHCWQSMPTPPSPAPPPHPDWSLWLSAPLFALLKTVLMIVAFLAVISLIATGKFFTHPLPQDVPVWLAVVVVVVVYQLLAIPFHALRHAYRYSAGYGAPCFSPFASFFGSLIGLAILFASLWYLNRHVPEFHEFLQKIPPALSSLIEALRAWWAEL